MASLISQLRNAPQPNQSVEQTRMLMQQMRNASNPQAFLASIIQTNPALAEILRSNGNLESIARSMAKAKQIDIDDLISQLNT